MKRGRQIVLSACSAIGFMQRGVLLDMIQQRKRSVYLALDAIGCRVDFSQDLLPDVRQFAMRCWQTWGNFEPNTLLVVLSEAEGGDASFAAALLFFQQPDLVREEASIYFQHPNAWVRWPLTILLAQQQTPGAFEAVCTLFPQDLTWNELHDVGDSSIWSYWRRQCVGLLSASTSPSIVPYVRDALYATIPFTHYEIDDYPWNTLCLFQCDLLALLQHHNEKQALQDERIPQLYQDLWQTTWVASSRRNAIDRIEMQELYRRSEIQSLLLQGLEQEFGLTPEDQQRALAAFMDYNWEFLFRGTKKQDNEENLDYPYNPNEEIPVYQRDPDE